MLRARCAVHEHERPVLYVGLSGRAQRQPRLLRRPCRLPFEANTLPEGKPGRLHHLSLKDNSVIDQLDKLQALGVASAKIEGRLRTPEYVAAAVSACLAGREGRAYDRDLLKNAFSRSGFTSGYLNGKIDGSMFGVRSEADAELTKKTLPMLRELYRRERSRVPVTMRLEIEEGGEKLTVTDADGSKAFAYGDSEPQPARTDPTESLRRSLAKTGGTPFEAADIAVEMDGGPWFVPGSTVNELRREALDALLKKREVLRPWPTTEEHVPALPQRTLPPHRTLRARFERWEQVPEQALERSGVSHPAHCTGRPGAPRVAQQDHSGAAPGHVRASWSRTPPAALRPRRTAGFAGYEASNIAHLRLCRGLPLSGGFGLNITNNAAAQFYAEQRTELLLILPEVKDSDIASIAPVRNGKPVPTGVMVYGHMPLMLTRACPLQNIHDCAHCDKTGTLTDRKAKKFPVRCSLGHAHHLQPGAHLHGRQARCAGRGLRRGLFHAGELARKPPQFWIGSAPMRLLKAISPADCISRVQIDPLTGLVRLRRCNVGALPKGELDRGMTKSNEVYYGTDHRKL